MGYISRTLSGKSELTNELLGTLGFVLVGTSALTAANVAGQATSPVVILVGFLSFSSALGWLTYILSSQHNVQLNPAVSILLWIKGEKGIRATFFAIIFQILGALIASVLVALLYGSAGVEARLGAPYPSTAMGAPATFAAELLGTMVFLGGCAAAFFSTISTRSHRAIIVGLSFGIGYLLSAGVSGGALNPARALAPQMAAADLTGWWIYIMAPVAAAVFIGLGSRMIRGKPDSPRSSQAKDEHTSAKEQPSDMPRKTEEQDQEAEAQALQAKAQEAIAKLRQANPESRTLPKAAPTPVFYEPAEEEAQRQGQPEQQSKSPTDEEQPSVTAQAQSNKPEVRFVEFEAEEDASE